MANCRLFGSPEYAQEHKVACARLGNLYFASATGLFSSITFICSWLHLSNLTHIFQMYIGPDLGNNLLIQIADLVLFNSEIRRILT